MPVAATFPRDGNYVPITSMGLVTKKEVTLTASNTTASNVLFKVTGSVQVVALYGIVTTALSNNITAAHWRLDDQTAQPAITLATGTTLSSFAVGSFISRRSLVSVALVGTNSSAGAVVDPVAATAPGYFMPFVVVQKTADVLTTIDFRYTTTNTPATGAITFYAGWVPLTEGSTLEAV